MLTDSQTIASGSPHICSLFLGCLVRVSALKFLPQFGHFVIIILVQCCFLFCVRTFPLCHCCWSSCIIFLFALAIYCFCLLQSSIWLLISTNIVPCSRQPLVFISLTLHLQHSIACILFADQIIAMFGHFPRPFPLTDVGISRKQKSRSRYTVWRASKAPLNRGGLGTQWIDEKRAETKVTRALTAFNMGDAWTIRPTMWARPKGMPYTYAHAGIL